MKHLITLVALLVSTAAVAQIPTLPWNPDENGDQFVGLPDLLGLLTVYGQEFENAIVAEDGESAIISVGGMSRHECEYTCDHLPGFWTLPKSSDLVPANALITGDVWLWSKLDDLREGLDYVTAPLLLADKRIQMTTSLYEDKECYCTAKQLPRVEYSVCADASNPNLNQHRSAASIEACCQQKVSEGWFPLGGTAESDRTVSQAFWRFAQ